MEALLWFSAFIGALIFLLALRIPVNRHACLDAPFDARIFLTF